MSHLSSQILQAVEELSLADQRQILDFAEFVLEISRRSRQIEPRDSFQLPFVQATGSEQSLGKLSFFDVAQAAIGAGEGPEDLSTNLDYMQEYGQ
jgi:hypothetical protein